MQIRDDRTAAGRGAATAPARVRFLALMLASAALAGTALALVAAIAVHSGQQARAVARGPVVAEDGRGAIALWRGSPDAVGGTPHDVIFVEPLVPSAPPPPGLRTWPAPGEVYLSPALARAGAGEHIGTRYGVFAGLIGKAGLLNASERLAYVRPARAPDARDRPEWLPVTGFGAPTVFGDATDAPSLHELLLAVGVFLGLPSLILVGTAVRHGPPGGRAVPIVPVLLGTALAALPLVVALCTPVTLPITGHVLDPADLRAAWPWAVSALAASSAVVFGAAAVVRPGPARPTAARGWQAAICAVAAMLIAAGQYFPRPAQLVAFGAGTVALWLTFPALAARVAGRLAPPPHPAVWARIAVTVLVGIGLVCLPPMWTSRTGGPAELAGAIKRTSGDRVLVVDSANLTPQRIDAFVRDLPAGVRVLGLGPQPGPGGSPDAAGVQLTGPCDAVRELGAPCSATGEPLPTGTPGAEALRAWYGTNTRVRTGAVGTEPDEPRSLVVVAPAGAKDDVRRTAYATLLFPEVGTPGSTWLLGADSSVTLGRWLLLSGYACLALLVTAASVRTAHDLLRSRPGALRLAVTVTTATLCGLAVALWHAQFFVVAFPGTRLPGERAALAGGLSWVVALTVTSAVQGVVSSAGRHGRTRDSRARGPMRPAVSGSSPAAARR